MNWLYRRGVTDSRAMTDLARGIRKQLAELRDARVAADR